MSTRKISNDDKNSNYYVNKSGYLKNGEESLNNLGILINKYDPNNKKYYLNSSVSLSKEQLQDELINNLVNLGILNKTINDEYLNIIKDFVNMNLLKDREKYHFSVKNHTLFYKVIEIKDGIPYYINDGFKLKYNVKYFPNKIDEQTLNKMKTLNIYINEINVYLKKTDYVDKNYKVPQYTNDGILIIPALNKTKTVKSKGFFY